MTTRYCNHCQRTKNAEGFKQLNVLNKRWVCGACFDAIAKARQGKDRHYTMARRVRLQMAMKGRL